jgi:hypothetical protein
MIERENKQAAVFAELQSKTDTRARARSQYGFKSDLLSSFELDKGGLINDSLSIYDINPDADLLVDYRDHHLLGTTAPGPGLPDAIPRMYQFSSHSGRSQSAGIYPSDTEDEDEDEDDNDSDRERSRSSFSDEDDEKEDVGLILQVCIRCNRYDILYTPKYFLHVPSKTDVIKLYTY